MSYGTLNGQNGDSGVILREFVLTARDLKSGDEYVRTIPAGDLTYEEALALFLAWHSERLSFQQALRIVQVDKQDA